MNYELAKKLKEFDFRQSGKGFVRCSAGSKVIDWGCDIVSDVDENKIIRKGLHRCNGFAYFPILSELIKACDGFLINLSRCTPYDARGGIDPKEMTEWLASGYMEKYTNHNTRFSYFTGKTPEEAVSSFWLALNKK